ncbi:MAG: DUF59 domain-containing protein [bacterium]|nr:DUF59 domain-containing protein [bacterium]
MLQRLLNRIYKKDKQQDVPEKQPSETSDAGLETIKDTDTAKPGSQPEGQAPPVSPAPAATNEAKEPPGELEGKIIDILHTVYDPEIPVDIYELGLIYEIKVDEAGMAFITMTLTAPNCPAAGILPGEVESKARSVQGVHDVKLDLVFEPPWDPSRMSEAAKLSLGMM